jgi:hypothetical protein
MRAMIQFRLGDSTLDEWLATFERLGARIDRSRAPTPINPDARQYVVRAELDDTMIASIRAAGAEVFADPKISTTKGRSRSPRLRKGKSR